LGIENVPALASMSFREDAEREHERTTLRNLRFCGDLPSISPRSSRHKDVFEASLKRAAGTTNPSSICSLNMR